MALYAPLWRERLSRLTLWGDYRHNVARSTTDQHTLGGIMAEEALGVNDGSVTRIAAVDVRNMIGELIDRAADGEPIIITRHERDRVVVISVREYERLRALEAAA
jgi:prevent-host-death family protein